MSDVGRPPEFGLEGEKIPEAQLEAYAREYIKTFDLDSAARAAGVTRHVAKRWLPLDRVQSVIRQLSDLKNKEAAVDAAEILQELVRIALADPLEAYTNEGDLRDLKDIPLSLRRTIASIDVEVKKDIRGVATAVVKKIKFWDKTKGLEMLGRHLSLFRDVLFVKDGNAQLDDSVIAARVSSLIEEIRRRAKDCEDLV